MAPGNIRFGTIHQDWLLAAGDGHFREAVLPLIYERLADSLDARQAYWMVVPGYLIIALYALWGHKIRTKGSRETAAPHPPARDERLDAIDM